MIDELVHYCIEQIGLDGDAGTEADRLAHFIRDFHAERASHSQLPHQLVDASYQAFVFRQLVSHPDVGVGLFVKGVPFRTGVKSGIGKRNASALHSPSTPMHESHAQPSPEYDCVDLLPDQSLAEQQGLFQLQQLHRDRLRLVLRSTLIKRLLVGANDLFLPPSAYRVLQIICRSREKPVISTQIGSALHTDQKTVFYMCKRLIDLDLVTKIKARETGTVASYFVATRFAHRCDILIQHRNADIAADLDQPGLTAVANHQSPSAHPSSSRIVSGDDSDEDAAGEAEAAAHDSSAPVITVKEEDSQDTPFQAKYNDNSNASKDASPTVQSHAPTFEHVDASRALLWMASRPELVRLRVYLVCNATSSKVTARHGLLQRINVAQAPSLKKPFITLLEHAVVDGLLEVVEIFVSSTRRTHRGLRITPNGFSEMHDLLRGEFGDAATIQEHHRASRLNSKLLQDLSRLESHLPRELTLERFVHEQVARAGPSGRTISQLMTQLHATGHFARSLDQIAQRAEEADGEPSMSDLRIRSFHEHKQRVRSTKFYSHHAWVLQGANDGYLDPDDLNLLASAGGPSSFHRKTATWHASEQVAHELTSLSKDLFTPTPRVGAARLGRPPKKRPPDFDPNTPPPKRGRPRKHPIDADKATPAADIPAKKRGRPRKHPIDSAAASPAGDNAPESACASSSRPETPATRDVEQTDSPLPHTSLNFDRRMPFDVDFGDRGVSAAPDSPTASVAKRRNRSLLQGQGTVRPTSLLASSPVVAEEPVASLVEEAASSESPIATQPAEQMEVDQVAEQDISHVIQSDETAHIPAAPSADLSRVKDLLAAPAQVKAEGEHHLATTPAAKKPSKATLTPNASERKKRTNLTQLRGSHALVQCIREAGGAMDSLLIPDLLSDFVEKHGFASDVQLFNLRDRKVREKALVSAINNGLLRRTYIRLDRPSAVRPKRQIIYDPELSADRLQNYCEAVKEGRDGWTDRKFAKTALMNATDSVAIDMDDARGFSKPWHTQQPLRLSDLPTEHAQLAMLRQLFRDVVSIYRQHLGFLSGEMLRLKAFHLACAQYLTSRQASFQSDDAVALPLSYFWSDAPLDLYLGLVPVPPVSEAIEHMMLHPEVRATPIQTLSDELKTSLGLSARGPQEMHVTFYSLAKQLSDLGIFKIHAAGEKAPGCEGIAKSSSDSPCTIVEPLHRIPFYDWAVEEEEKPLTEVIEVGLDVDKINLFWAKMQACCLKWRRLVEGESSESQGAIANRDPTYASGFDANRLLDFDPFRTVPGELVQFLYASRAWRPYHQLRPSQAKFLYRIDVQDMRSATQQDIDKLAYVTLLPKQAIRAVLQKRLECANEPVGPEAPLFRSKQPRFTWPLRLSTICLPTNLHGPRSKAVAKRKRTQTEREKQGRATTLAKARQLRQKRQEDFQEMLDHAISDASLAYELRAKIETALEVIRRKFVAGDVRFDASAVQEAILRAIRSASGVRTMPAVRAPSAGRRKRRAQPDTAEPNRESEQLHQHQDANADDEEMGAGSGKAGARRDRRNRRKNIDQIHFWTPARKELLRDAAVILRVRDQVRGRTDWSALIQIVDGEERTKTKPVIMAQWRHQYNRMRNLHGEEAYLSALESRWIPVYLSARESGILQDADFPAPTGFDLVAQIGLLRDEIDKNEVQRSLTRPIARHHLPLELGAATDFTNRWEEEFAEEPVERRFEPFFTHETGVTTKRLETLLSTAWGAEAAGSEGKVKATVADLMAEWAVRIVIASASPGTEAQDSMATQTDEGSSGGATQLVASPVDEMTKSDFCRAVGDTRIEEAMQRLLDAKLIRSLTLDPVVRRKPGTNFVFTEELLKLLPDPNAANRLAAADVQATLTHRRSAFQDLCDAEHGLLLEPVEADGETAAIVLSMEAGLIDAEIDMQPFEVLRQNAALNARVLNDEDLEALIRIQGKSEMMDELDAAVIPLPAVPKDQVLDRLAPGAAGGDQAELAEAEQTAWLQQLELSLNTFSTADPSAAERLRSFGTCLLQSRTSGLSLDSDDRLSYTDVLILTRRPLPLAFFSPLSACPILIASPFVEAYALSIPSRTSTALTLTLPHIWSTLSGASTHHWRHLLETLIALTLQRPGLNLAWLAFRFSAKVESVKGGGRVVGTSFADVWSATTCLLDLGVVEMRTEEGVGLEGWTLHPGSKRKIWAGFR